MGVALAVWAFFMLALCMTFGVSLWVIGRDEYKDSR